MTSQTKTNGDEKPTPVASNTLCGILGTPLEWWKMSGASEVEIVATGMTFFSALIRSKMVTGSTSTIGSFASTLLTHSAASRSTGSIFGSWGLFFNRSLIDRRDPILGISTNGVFVQHGSPFAIFTWSIPASCDSLTSNSCDRCCLRLACTGLHLCGSCKNNFFLVNPKTPEAVFVCAKETKIFQLYLNTLDAFNWNQLASCIKVSEVNRNLSSLQTQKTLWSFRSLWASVQTSSFLLAKFHILETPKKKSQCDSYKGCFWGEKMAQSC